MTVLPANQSWIVADKRCSLNKITWAVNFTVRAEVGLVSGCITELLTCNDANAIINNELRLIGF